MLVSHAFDENELLEDEVYKLILSGKLSMNKGMLYVYIVHPRNLMVKDDIVCIPPYMVMML